MNRYFISYPKSGRSWIRYALHQLGVDKEISFQHDGFEFNDGARPPHDFDLDARRQRYASPVRVVYLVRDPRDVMVSLYHQVTGRFRDFFNYQASLSEFIRDGYFGATVLARFRLMWQELARNDNVLVVSYEDCHRDMATVLSRILRHFDLHASDDAIRAAVSAASLERMREVEAKGVFPEPWLVKRNDAPKVRKGKVGTYREELTQEDVAYIEQVFCLDSGVAAPFQDQPRQALVVLGMHRSGTSALTGSLALAGLATGTELQAGNQFNEKGYWEDVRIVAAHDQLLGALGSSWDDVDPMPENWLHSSEAEACMRTIIDVLRGDYLESPIWLMKDPRMCRVMPMWMEIFSRLKIQPRFVLPLRHPDEVVASLQSRDGLTTDYACLMWLQHTLLAEFSSSGYPRARVSYESLLDDWRPVLAGLNQQLDLGLKLDSEVVAANIEGFLSDDFRHGRFDPDKPKEDGSLEKLAADIYMALTQPEVPEQTESELNALCETICHPEFLAAFHARFEKRLPVAKSEARFEVGVGHHEPDVRLIAFYLPQFHPTPENDEWWGKGFTEWANVAKAQPLFPGHHQPQLPADLGFYDLRLPETRIAQAQLAREFGIHGFCYYYYWFAGRRILERPLQEVFDSGQPDFPFCICWANETWSRRWDGSEKEVLIQQEHTQANDDRFILDVLPLFRDPRYIRVDGAPLLMVYRAAIMADPVRTTKRWREICAEQGIAKVHLCAVESFGLKDVQALGFDSAVAFPPHGVVAPDIGNQVRAHTPDYSGFAYDYNHVVQNELARPRSSGRAYPGVMPAWDNTARRGKASNIFLNSSPEAYEIWLESAIERATQTLPPGERLVFINAWNEWAEGAHLEPDTRYGHAYLEATRRALAAATSTGLSRIQTWARRREFVSGFLYEAWRKEQARAKQEYAWMAERMAHWTTPLKLHLAVILPLDKAEHLLSTLESLEQQLYVDAWALTIVADAPEPAGLAGLGVIHWVQAGPAMALQAANTALLNGDADWVGMLEAGDRLPPHAMYGFADAAMRHPDWQLIYSDEDAINAQGEHRQAYFKSDFSIDLVRGAPFALGGLAMYRRDLFDRLGGFDPAMEGVEYWDIALRSHELTGTAGIGHVADILYHRFDAGGHCTRSSEELAVTRQQALSAHLQRAGLSARIGDGLLPGSFHVRYLHATQPLVSIIVPTKDQEAMLRRCIDSVLARTAYPNYEILLVDNGTTEAGALAYLRDIQADARVRVLRYPAPYNYSAMNNLAAREAKGDYLLLLNNDTAITQSDWLDEMMALGQRDDVGIVGARLLFPDGRIQHAGVVLGLMGRPAEHPFIGANPEDPGYFGRTLLTQDLSAVTAACLLIRKAVFDQVGGLDEKAFQVSCNDVDLCLKVRQLGSLVAWTPYVTLLHEGSKSQREGTEGISAGKQQDRLYREADAMFHKWAPLIAHDPFYNRNLSLANRDFRIETVRPLTLDPEVRPRPRILVHPADFEGSGEYRLLAPLRSLTERGLVQAWASAVFRTVPELLRMSPDAVVFQRQYLPLSIETMEYHYVRHSKAFRVYEVDDLITNVPVKNRHKAYFDKLKDMQKTFRKAVSLCSRLVVPTEYLAQEYKGFTDEVVVAANYLERAVWDKFQPARGQGGKLRVGWAGSNSHDGDLELMVDVVKATADEVDWVFLGLCPESIRGLVSEFHPAVSLKQYPAKLASLNLDLAVAPLEDVPFNHGKSHLKILEYGILGYPVIATDITPYRGAFPITRVPNRFKDWVEAIRAQVADREELARRGDALRDHIRANWMLDDHLDVWLKAWLPS